MVCACGGILPGGKCLFCNLTTKFLSVYTEISFSSHTLDLECQKD